MITCGIDVGAGTTKGALLEDGKRLLALAATPTKGDLNGAALRVRAELEGQANVVPGEVDYVCTTGFGRYSVEDRQLQVSDITSSARGAHFLRPGVHHVIDIGCQATRSIAVDERGRVKKFRMNQKCAAGGGRFVERCAKYLQVPLETIGERALHARNPPTVSSVCAVLAETEIINFVTEEIAVEDILMGVLLSLAQRAQGLMKTVGIEPEVALVGGLARNGAMVRALTQTIGTDVHADERALHAAAIGAAVLGNARLLKRTEVVQR